ncbi:MAG: hypothetical protein ACRBFS_13965 [Aureispira sp.]
MGEESTKNFEATIMQVFDDSHTPEDFIAKMEKIADEQIDNQEWSFFYMAGRKLYHEKLFEYALVCCQKAVNYLLPISRKYSINNHYMLGDIYYNLGQPLLSIENFHKSITLCNEDKIFLDFEYNSYLIIANITQEKSVYKDIIALVSKHHDYKKLVDCYLDLGNFHIDKKEFIHAEHNYKEAIKIFNNYAVNDNCFLARAYLGLGNVYRSYHILNDGVEYTRKALEIFEANTENDKYDIASCHSNLGNIYLDYALKRSPSEFPKQVTNEVQYYIIESLNHFSFAVGLFEEINEQDLLDDIIIKVASLGLYINDLDAIFSKKISNYFSSLEERHQIVLSKNKILEISLLEIIERQAQHNLYIVMFASLILVDIYLYHSETPNILSATECIQKALQLPAKNHWAVSKLQGEYGIILYYEEKFQKSYYYLCKSINANETHYQNIINDKININIYGEDEDFYHYMILVCLELDKSNEALYHLEASKSKAFRELLLTTNLSRPKGAENDFLTQEQQLISYLKNTVLYLNETPQKRLEQATIAHQLKKLYKSYALVLPAYTSIRLGKISSYANIKQAL